MLTVGFFLILHFYKNFYYHVLGVYTTFLISKFYESLEDRPIYIFLGTDQCMFSGLYLLVSIPL